MEVDEEDFDVAGLGHFTGDACGNAMEKNDKKKAATKPDAGHWWLGNRTKCSSARRYPDVRHIIIFKNSSFMLKSVMPFQIKNIVTLCCLFGRPPLM